MIVQVVLVSKCLMQLSICVTKSVCMQYLIMMAAVLVSLTAFGAKLMALAEGSRGGRTPTPWRGSLEFLQG